MLLHHLVEMPVGAFVFAVSVGMAVNMLVLMGVNQFSMLMFMGMDMDMLVSVLQGDGGLFISITQPYRMKTISPRGILGHHSTS